MKRFLTIAAALALVLGLSQCRKPNAPTINGGNGETIVQHITVGATCNGGNSKVSGTTAGNALNLTWDAGDKMIVDRMDVLSPPNFLTLSEGAGTASGKFSGTIEGVAGTTKLAFVHGGSGAHFGGSQGAYEIYDAQFKDQNGKLEKTETGDKAGVEYNSILDRLILFADNIDFIASSAAEYDVDLEVPYAILKLDLSAFGTTGDGNEVRIYKEEETNPIATVLNVKDDSNVLYVALPTDNPSTTPDPAEITYRFVGNNKVVTKLWGIKKNTFYTQKEDTGKAIVVAPESPTKASPSATTLESCVNCEQVLKGKVTPNETQTCEYGLVYAKKSVNADPVLYGTGCTMVKDNAASLSSEVEYAFDFDPDDFEKGVEYVVKAYAIGENGVPAYGEAKIFEFPTSITWNGGGTPGASPYEFSVSATTKVRFSQGNLQYVGSAEIPYWKFAEHQFDFLGKNGQGSTSETVDRDLFGWGTSGWSNGNIYYQPHNTGNSGNENNCYGYGPTDGINYTYNLTGDYAEADWGVYNAISNGGNAAGTWRTLTKAEWEYLIETRTGASSKWGLGTVGGCTPGLIILPDEWTSGCTFTPGKASGFSTNTYTFTQWHDMEAAGAVFLPAAGQRNGDVYFVGSYGNYWSSSYFENYKPLAYNLMFYSDNVMVSTPPRNYGISVRLVR